MKIRVINGPGINIVDEHGHNISLNSINERLARQAETLGISCDFFTGSDEGELVTMVQDAWGVADGVILNPGDYAHFSIAIRDAVASINKPVIEVRHTNIHEPEGLQRASIISAVCNGVISGFGQNVYFLALQAFYSRSN